MARDSSVWSTEDRSRWFLIPNERLGASGTLSIRSLEGASTQVDADWIAPFEVTEEQARRWAKDQLGRTLEELKTGIDDKLADLRQQLDELNRRPVSEESTITPDAASALFDFIKALPRVVGQSISGDEQRVDKARAAMADLQRRLKESGIDVDDRVKGFPERLAGLRKKPGQSAE